MLSGTTKPTGGDRGLRECCSAETAERSRHKDPSLKPQQRSWSRVRDLAADERRKSKLPVDSPRIKPTLAPTGTLTPPPDPDAVEIGALYRRAMIESIRRLIEAGQRLKKKKDSLGHGNWLPWLKANAAVLGFGDSRTAERLLKAAKFDAGVEYDETEARRISRVIWGHNTRGAGGTGNNEWNTPPEYIELVREVLGTIDLDPATNDDAQQIIQAKIYYTKETDGLLRDWFDKTFLNSPYSRELIGKFIHKLCEEIQAGRIPEAIALTHNYTDTEWFNEIAKVADRVCFTQGRIRFQEPSGKPAKPTQGQAFFYIGPNVQRFDDVFESVGNCYPRLSRAYRPPEDEDRGRA